MDTFFAIAFSFPPTVIFSVLLCVAIVYWLISLVGLGDIEADGDIDASGDFSGLMVTLGGLQGVPLPLVLTLLFLIAWLASYFAELLLGALVPDGFLHALFGLAVIAGALVMSVLVTAVVIRPLRPLFRRAYLPPPLQKRIIGTACVITSATVTETKGRAEAILDGAIWCCRSAAIRLWRIASARC